MTQEERDQAVHEAVAGVMRDTARIVRDECASIVRQFGGKMTAEELAKLIEGMPLPGEGD